MNNNMQTDGGKSTSGHWDFTVDSDLQKEYAMKQKNLVDIYNQKVEEMYRSIHYLGENDYWRGQDYNLFVSGMDGYRTALRDLGESVRAYANHFDNKLMPATEKLADELYQILTRAFEYKDLSTIQSDDKSDKKTTTQAEQKSQTRPTEQIS